MILQRAEYITGYQVRELDIDEELLKEINFHLHQYYATDAVITFEMIEAVVINNPEDPLVRDMHDTACPYRRESKFTPSLFYVVKEVVSDIMWDYGEIVEDQTDIAEPTELELV